MLVVDDDPWILRMVSSSLEKKGTYAVDTARDGQQAMRRAQAARPDIVISDVMMPVMDGWALVQELRNDPNLASVPVLFLTALGKDEDRLHALGLKPEDYLSKPFRFDDLERRVLKMLAGRNAAQQSAPQPQAQPQPQSQPPGGAYGPGFGQPLDPGFGPGPGHPQPGRAPIGPGGYGPQPGRGPFGPGPGYGQQPYGPPGAQPYVPPNQGGGQSNFGPLPRGPAPAYPQQGYPQTYDAYGNPAQPGPGPAQQPPGPGYGQPSGGYGYGRSPAPPYGPPGAAHHPPPPREEPAVPEAIDPGSSGSFSGAMKRTGLSGRLEQLGLSSLLVMMEMERKDGVLQLQNGEDKQVGRIFLRKGQVIQAKMDSDGEERGPREVVYYMLTWTKGRFHFSVMDVEMEDVVQTSTTSLLMEGARLIDEANR